MNRAQKIYQRLHRRFGPQGWWPSTPEGQHRPIYYPGQSPRCLSERDRFEICVGAILTQNTAWTNVEKALHQLHLHRALSPQKISAMSPAKLAKLILSSGYFTQKSKKLKIFCDHLLKNYNGKVSEMGKRPLLKLREELLGIWGIGPETADSMLLYALGMPVFVVDAYTRRVGNRIGLFKTEDYGEVQKFFESNLPHSAELFNEYHALIVELAKNTCKTKPLCGDCPLKGDCAVGLTGRK